MTGETTELLYYGDAYLREFEARVVGVRPGAVALDRTAFYPGGGGQPADSGALLRGASEWRVAKAKREGGLVWHLLEDGTETGGLDEGVDVSAKIDWDRRLALMRTHTALHILCGVVWREHGASVTGGNMEPGRGRMDFEFETMSQELVQSIEERINEEAAKARPIHTKILPREEAFEIPDLIRTKINLLPEGIAEVRVVEIEGLDLQADGGTHVANTSEVGRIRVTGYKSKGRSNKRIEIALE